MDEGRIWGGLGILLALVGVGIIALDHEFTEALLGGGVELIVLYGAGVVLAALVTIAIIGPSVVSR